MEKGILTSIWGSKMWFSLHCVSFTYPDNPTNDDKENYKNYFKLLQYVLPCCICRKHFKEHTSEGGAFKIVDSIFDNKNTLTEWLFNFHHHVNKSLGIEYDITYEDLCNKFNSYIVDHETTFDEKTTAFNNLFDKEAPLLSYEKALKFSGYAEERGLKNFQKNLDIMLEIYKSKRINGDISDNWKFRNDRYWNILKKMRIKGICGFENSDSSYKNLPTIHELKLIQLMGTSLSKNTIDHMIEKIEKFEKIK
jgi:hypothetical protein